MGSPQWASGFWKKDVGLVKIDQSGFSVIINNGSQKNRI
jgi:hypothetical protein